MLGKRKPSSSSTIFGSQDSKYGSAFSRAVGAANVIGAAYSRYRARRGGKRQRVGPRLRMRSRTALATGIRRGKIVAEGTGGQYSSFTLVKPNYLEKTVNHTLAPVKSVFNGSSQILSAVGKQQAGAVLSLFDHADVTACYGDIIGGTLARINLQKATASVMLSNIFLSNVTIDIYDVIARKDLVTAATATGVMAWASGDTDEGTANEYLKLGSTPFQTELFNQYYRVAQVTRVILGSGQMHRHHVNIDPHKLMTYSYLNNCTYGFRELTYETILVVRGAPANDTVVQTQVTVGAGGVNVVYEKEYTTVQLANNNALVRDHSTLATAFTTAEQVVDLGGTTITTNAEG